MQIGTHFKIKGQDRHDILAEIVLKVVLSTKKSSKVKVIILYDYWFANSIHTFLLCKYKKIVHMVILIHSNPFYTMHVCNMCRNHVHMYINVMQVGQGQSLRMFIADWEP